MGILISTLLYGYILARPAADEQASYGFKAHQSSTNGASAIGYLSV